MSRPCPDDLRTANLLGALATALGDAVRRGTEEAAGHGAAGPAALATLTAYPGQPLDALRRVLGLSPGGATRLADRLEADGLLERRQGEGGDGRSVAVRPTEAGRARAAAVLGARRDALARALAPLSAAERDGLAGLLERMLGALTPDRATCDRTCRLCDLDVCPQEACPVERAALAAEAGR